MKLCRFLPLEASEKLHGRPLHELHAASHAGILEGEAIREISGDLWGPRNPIGKQWQTGNVKLLPPSYPSKIVCVGKNYADHVSEMGGAAPKEPLIFLKPPSAIIAPEEAIILPPSSQRVDYEGELALVIGGRCSRLGPNEDPRPWIAGYTCLNDVTARDLQKRDVEFTRAKGFDTFCPFGPVLQTEQPPRDASVETFVNGARKQSGRFEQMLFPIEAILRFITQVMTLEPGDIISTGTPSGVGPLAAGDVVEVRISTIGTLRNTVVAQPGL